MNKSLFDYVKPDASPALADTCWQEQQHCQHDAVAEEDPLQTLTALDQTTRAHQQACETDTAAVVSLESIAAYIQKVSQTQALDPQALVFANLAIESITQQVALPNERLTFSLEAYAQDPQQELHQALEGIQAKIDSLFAGLKVRMVKLAEHMALVMRSFNQNIQHLKQRVHTLEQALETATRTEPKFPLIKPEPWCAQLCYLDTGFDTGLKRVGKDLHWLLASHRELMQSSIGKYTQWFKQHASQAQDDFVFRALKVRRTDFLLPGMTEFNRSQGYHGPHANNLFYRSRELPGGKAFFTEIETTDKNGLAAVNMLRNVRFNMDHYDPVSYRLQKAKLSLILGLSFQAWMLAINPFIGTLGIVAALRYNKTQQLAGTGHVVKIDPNYLFPVLSRTELKATLNEVKQGLVELERWNQAVLQKPWKSAELNTAIDRIIGLDRTTVHNGVGVRYMREYCHGLLNLLNQSGHGIHTYAFRTYSAMLAFSEKSLKQYQ